MKTKITIIFALLALNISLVSARNNFPKSPDGSSRLEINASLNMLAPATPKEAIFEDLPDMNGKTSYISSFAPAIPKQANIEELISTDTSIMNSVSDSNKVKTIEKGSFVHPDLPRPCDAKYGCSL
ncbi:MAG: hypothetical protein ABSD71_04785 [Bacteroidales bacterium]